MKYLTNIDLNKNQLVNPVIHLLGTTPSSPTEGQVYYDSTTHGLYVYNGTAFFRLALTGQIVNADIASGAAIALSKLATDPLARANHTGTQLAATISDLATAVQAYRLDQFANPTTSVSLNSQKITSLANGTSSNDAVNLSQLQSIQAGLDPKASVRAATTANITLSGAQTIDGVSIIAGDRVLVKDQSTGSQNGIYVAASGSWSRATDADTDAEVTAGMFTFIEEGTVNGDSGWTLSTNNPITLGSTALTFVQFSSSASLTAGNGLTKTGSTIDVVGTSNRISVAADSIDIDSAYVGQTSITTLGTVATGTWSATTIALNKGGTGSTTASGARTNLGAVGKYTALIGDGSATSFVINQATHGLAADMSNMVVVYEVSSEHQIYCDVAVTAAAGAVSLQFATAPATNAMRVVIIG